MARKRTIILIMFLLVIMVTAQPVFAEGPRLMPNSCANALGSAINPWGGGAWLYWGTMCALDLDGWLDPFNM